MMADPVDDDMLPLIGVHLGQGDGDDSSNSSSFDSDEEPDEEENAGIDDDDEEEASGEERDRHNRGEGEESTHRSASESGSGQVIVNFDKSLPATHSYLGDDMDELRGRTILEENSHVTMPILLLPNVVLVPGQVIPLYLNTFRSVAMVRRAAETDKTFGVLSLTRSGSSGDVSDIGCTAEIFCIKDESDSSLSILRAKAVGRQRFKVMDSLVRDIAGGLTATVKILPEKTVSHALDGASLPSLFRFMAQSVSDDQEDLVKTAVGRHGQVLTSVDMRPKNPIGKMFLSHSTPWPSWVYRLYDVECLCEQIKVEVENWSGRSLPKDPIALSYWIAHNLPVDDNTRLFILSLDSVVQRLRFGLSVIQKSSVLLQCNTCGKEISSKKEIFSMTESGPTGAYVNPGGYVHEMFTVHATKNLSHLGRPSTEHSWFPGYAWTIVQCKGCGSHMGWRFTAVESHLSPRKLWGLCRSSVETTFATTADEADSEENRSPPIYIM